jgi:hypothetical protein
MTRRIINIGQQGNDGTGDSIRIAFSKVNENFKTLYAAFGVDGALTFKSLDDTPSSYLAGQIFYTESENSISSRTLIAGDGISINTNIPGELIIGLAGGLSSDAPRLTGGLNAKDFPIANAAQPDDPQIEQKISDWNIAQQSTGDIISVNDILISKGYADSRYLISDGTVPITVRSTPTSGAAYIKTITGVSAGDAIVPGHGLSALGADNGKAFRFNGNSLGLTNGVIYYARYRDSTTISLHSTRIGAAGQTPTAKVSILSLGTGPETLTLPNYNTALPGFWLEDEAVRRSDITLRSGDTMTGLLTLSGNPTNPLHAATKEYVDTAVASKDNTDEITEGTTNLYFTNERVDDRVSQLLVAGNNISISYDNNANTLTISTSSSGGLDLSNNNTNQLAEGSTNLYYTNTRARSALSVNDAGGDGSLSYNSSTGVFTYTGPSATEVRAHFSAGTGVNYDAITGIISIGQFVNTNSNVRFNDIEGTGTLDITGSATIEGTLTIGTPSAGGSLTSAGNLSVTGSITGAGGSLTSAGNLSVTGSITGAGGSLTSAGNLTINGNVVTTAATVNLANTTTTIVNAFGAATEVNVGSTSGLTTVNHNLKVLGNLIVEGNTVSEVEVSGTVITLASQATTPAEANGAGIQVNGANVSITYNSTLDQWVFDKDIITNVVGQVSDISNHNTDSLEEGSFNLYFTSNRAIEAARTGLSVVSSGIGNLVYDELTGVFTHTGITSSDLGFGLLNSNGIIELDPVGVVSRPEWEGFIASLEELTTDDFFEGSFNLYFTANRAIEAARTGLSVVSSGIGNLVYDELTGVFTHTGITSSDLGYGLLEVSGAIEVDPTEIVSRAEWEGFIASLEELTTDDFFEGSFNLYFTANRAIEAARTGLLAASTGPGSLLYDELTGEFTYTGPTASEIRPYFSAGTGVSLVNGEISIGQPVGITNNVQFNDLIVTGNLTVNGTTTTINTEEVNIADNIIVLNSNETGAPTQNSGVEIERGTQQNVQLRWNETSDRWENTRDGVTYYPLSINTDELLEGTSNLYYTTSRTTTDSRLSLSVTDSGGDGSLSYNNSTGVFTYTGPSAAEVRAHFSNGTDISIVNGTVSVNSDTTATPNTLVKRNASGDIVANRLLGNPVLAVTTGTVIPPAGLTLTLENLPNIFSPIIGANRTLILPAANTATGRWIIIRNNNASTLTIESFPNISVTTISPSSVKQFVCDGDAWFEI